MRGARGLVVLAGAAVLAAGCGTELARPANLAAAVTSTAGRTARVAVTMTMRSPGMSVSFTETGVFDFAHARGMLRMRGPAGVASEELFIPPKMYVKLPGGAHALPGGKSWAAFGAPASGGFAAPFLGPFGGADPANLLSSLTAVASRVTNVGSATIGGVQVTALRVSVVPAKAASRLPRWQRAGFQAFSKSLGAATIPVEVWVDNRDLVRQIRMSLHPPAHAGAPPGANITQIADFYDFGTPVRVAAPPPADVASTPQFAKGTSTGRGFAGPTHPRPPRASGTLSPAQAAAAEKAVGAFWMALGHNDPNAVAKSVLPSQRACLRPIMTGLRFSVTSLRTVSAQAAGAAQAVVRFTVKAHAMLHRHRVAVLPEGPGRIQWLVAAHAGGHWYVNLGRSSVLFGPACR